MTAPRQSSLFDGARMDMRASIELTVQSLNTYGPRHRHWSIAWSGGKDSTTLVTLVLWLIASGQVEPPETLTILFADTRMELLPLSLAVAAIREEIEERGYSVQTVIAPLDRRFLVYILGRGVQPPNNNTLRWCTRQIKVDPMTAELQRLQRELVRRDWVHDKQARYAAYRDYRMSGETAYVAYHMACEARQRALTQKVLVLTGVRQGESAVRDGRIAMSCGRNGGECGQGWYQETLPEAVCDTLAPLLHWRVCHVWAWLKHWAPSPEFGDWTTKVIADAYGGDEAEEINARTGCVGCPLASRDTALDAMLAMERWAYLAPLKRLREIYRWLRLPGNRLRKPGGEARADGTLVKNQQRMGPITLEARLQALSDILAVQDEVNATADELGRPHIDVLNAEEVARIHELIAAKTWPQRWTGDEPTGDELFDAVYADGSIQFLLPGMKGTP